MGKIWYEQAMKLLKRKAKGAPQCAWVLKVKVCLCQFYDVGDYLIHSI